MTPGVLAVKTIPSLRHNLWTASFAFVIVLLVGTELISSFFGIQRGC